MQGISLPAVLARGINLIAKSLQPILRNDRISKHRLEAAFLSGLQQIAARVHERKKVSDVKAEGLVKDLLASTAKDPIRPSLLKQGLPLNQGELQDGPGDVLVVAEGKASVAKGPTESVCREKGSTDGSTNLPPLPGRLPQDRTEDGDEALQVVLSARLPARCAPDLLDPL